MYKCFSCLAANRAYLTYCMVGVWCLLVAAFALPFALLLISLFYCAYEHSDNSYSLGWTGCDSRLNSSQRDCALQVSPHERMYNPKHWWPRGSLHHSRYTLQCLWIRPCESTSKASVDKNAMQQACQKQPLKGLRLIEKATLQQVHLKVTVNKSLPQVVCSWRGYVLLISSHQNRQTLKHLWSWISLQLSRQASKEIVAHSKAR